MEIVCLLAPNKKDMVKLVTIVYWTVACIFLCVGLSATSVPKTSIARVKQVVEGDNLLIVCNANQTASVDIFWTNVNSTFRQNGTLLTFVKINRSSAGEYVCYSVYKTTGHETDNATVVDVVDVDVQFPAEVTHFSITPSTVLENNTLTITCTVIGNPVPQYKISHGFYTNTSTLSGTVTFTSRPTNCGYSGLWTCSAKNTLKNGTTFTASQGQNVTVLCAPTPIMLFTHLYNVTARPGDQAKLKMYNAGYPYPNYTWTHNGTVLPKFMHTDYVSYEWQFSILNISSVSYTDFGNYYVTMTNDIGSYVAEYRLLPVGPPERPTNLTVSDVTFTGATLRWVSGFDMWQNQTFVIYRYIRDSTFVSVDSIYPNYTDHGVDQVLTYKVRGLDSGTNYALEVASEVPGYIGYTNAVRFKTKGTPPTRSPQTNSAEAILTSPNLHLTVMMLFLTLILFTRT